MTAPDRAGPAGGRFESGEFRYPVRVYYEDTDAGGVVYHANYLRYAERARTEMLRALGVVQSDLRTRTGVSLVVRRCLADFRAAARLDDALEVRTRITAMRGATIEADQDIYDPVRRTVLVALALTIACVTESGRPTRLPEPIRQAAAAAAG